ncbi:MAG: alpha/beta hydrolase [Deltaproteobacteria bacterium]|nr:alpha/beta hydrolase [Deltaproteobacteria bacterium]
MACPGRSPPEKPLTRPLVLLAHGAGAGQSSPFMKYWRSGLEADCDVSVFEYAYMRKPGRRPPPRLPTLLAEHQEKLDTLRDKHPSRQVFLVGKSMGSRVGCHLANAIRDHAPVQGLVCLGYPLKGRSSLRDEVLRELRTPVLFVQGTRDPLCPLALLAEVRPAMASRNDLHVVQGGDHSLQLRKRDRAELSVTQEEVDATSLAATLSFISELASS